MCNIIQTRGNLDIIFFFLIVVFIHFLFAANELGE